MADRYFHVDVRFMHKRTADHLYEEFGYAGPLVFLALCAQAKSSDIPGVFVYENEAIAWAKLGFEGRRPKFTLDRFLTFTGRIKQTSRTRRGRMTNVELTQYGRWQKDGWRQNEREKKARIRAQKTGDSTRDTSGTSLGTKIRQRTRTRTTPQTPQMENGKHPHDCPKCGARQPSQSALETHLELFHQESEDIPFESAGLPNDDIPFR